MKKIIILFIMSPYRANSYDFKNLKKPVGAELLIISDSVTLDKYNLNEKFLTKEVPLIEYKELGYTFLSINSIENIIQEYRDLGYDVRLHSDEELSLESVALLNEKYGLKGMNTKETKPFRDKFSMKTAIKKPKHFKVPKFTKTFKSAQRFRLPVIAKPLSSAGAIGVIKINTLPELFEFFQTHDQNYYIIEEFIEGILYHCDAFVYQGKLKFFMAGQYFFPVEYATKNLDYLGSEIVNEKSTENILLKATKEVIQLMKIKSSVIHIEFILQEGNLFFVEIGKRPAGAWIPKMYQIGRGINLYNYHLYSSYPKLNLKEQNIQPSANEKYCCGLHLLRQKNNQIKEIEIPEEQKGFTFHYFLDKWKSLQKTNSSLDFIAEVYFYSNNEENYRIRVENFLSHHEIIYENAKADND